MTQTHTPDMAAEIERLRSVNAELLAALKLALPHLQQIAATAPTEYHRAMRQQAACRAADAARALISKAEGRA